MRAASSSERWRRFSLRPLTIATFVVLMGLVVLTTGVIGRIADQQDRRLRVQKTSEAALVLESALQDVELRFSYLGGIVQAPADPAQDFELAAETLVDSVVRGIGRAEVVDGSFTSTALVGEGPGVGRPLSDEWQALLSRARSEQDMVTGVLPAAAGDGTRVGFADAVEGTPTLLFMELRFEPRGGHVLEAESPFGELSGRLYAGLEPDPAQLVFTTADEAPLTGDVLRATVDVGADEWLLLTTTDGPIVRPLVLQTRWGVLIGGFALALVTAALVQLLSRRQAYAQHVVEQRTAELHLARQVAEDANRSKSEFLSRMSHELRTPLNAVLGFGQLLEMEPLSPEQKRSVDQVLKGGRHLLDLINEVLDISRIEAGELSLSPEAVSVEELLRETVDLIRPLAEQNGIQMVLDRSEAFEHYVFADRQRAKQVLLNLLSNAVKYNRPRGSVAVSCSEPSGTLLQIRVTDTGAGISADRLERIFTPFERLGAEQTAVEGTGIGLALSQGLATAMGGRVGVESTVGRGSTFFVELPRVEGPVERYERLDGDAAEPGAAPRTPDRTIVLHIEDNLSNLTLIERIFAQRPDVEVIAAMHGGLALELAREHAPVLILLDLHLPDMGGDEVLQRLRDDPATASIPVVIVSADATPGRVQRLLTAGASAYLTKPIQVRELLKALDDALAAR